jgi:SPP1 gp7 family putative phage head morphogenesis protein
MIAAHPRTADAIERRFDRADAAIRDLWQRLPERIARSALRHPPAMRRYVIEITLQRTIRRMLAVIADSLVDGRSIAASALARAIPSDLVSPLRDRLSPEPIREAVGPRDPVVVAMDLQPATVGQRSARTLRAAVAQAILPPLRRADLIRIWTAPTPTSDTLERRLSSRLWDSAAKAAIEAALTAGISSGQTVTELSHGIRTVVSAPGWQARRIARTEMRRALERDHMHRTLGALGDMVTGLIIQAVLDDRTRPEHRRRHGRVYRRSPDGTFRDRHGQLAPDLPDAPNCRCTYVPMLAPP